jgi:hypothetical protein
MSTEPNSATVAPRPGIVQRVKALNWQQVLLVALLTAAAWDALFLANNFLQILAGIVPVMAGIYLGRKVADDHLMHGIMLGLTAFVFGLLGVLVYGQLGNAGLVPMPTLQLEADSPAAVATSTDLTYVYLMFSVFALLPFPAFGTVMAGRSEQRNRQMQADIEARGGRLEKPGVIRTLEDLQGLSLPQLGSFVASLYRKKGFEFRDYRFIDKDRHLDIEMEYEKQRYLIRMSVADKVRSGTVESLLQDMKRKEIGKGVVITSTEFTPDVHKSAAGRQNMVIIDGKTLFAMAEV